MISLVSQFGSPLYVYDESVIQRQAHLLKESLAYPDTLFCYAMKANSNLAILDTVRKLGFGVDCVSRGELELALMAGFDPSVIRFTPSFALTDEIRFAVEKGAQVTLDSLPVLEWYLGQFPDIPAGLRLNPSVMAGAYDKTSTGHAKAKFGIGMDLLAEVLRLVASGPFKINGLHIHSGSDILETDQFMKAVEVLLSAAPRFKSLDYIALGSGFKVPYFEGDKKTDMAQLGKTITDRFTGFCADYGRPLRLIFEPGKFLVSEAGTFLVTCTWVKENGGIRFAGVDSGFNHLIRPMFYGAWHTITNLSNPQGIPEKYDVVGNICETDTFASDRMIPEIRPGDILAFANAGAYCYSMASSYNSRPRPAEVYLQQGEARLIRHRETLQHLLSLQIPLPS
ncbi:MAG TPA: diaminopimelate decarboxylase [Saprospiraceae bacterium]|nr:diaminopimelate decarboxylase [Saprospiraceae bacterium]HNT18855.1 diaminopimelate decarboxylase [Saprospiraceae bacterium]